MIIAVIRGNSRESFRTAGGLSMVKLIIEPKKGKDGQIEFTVTYHDVKTDNQFTVTTTNDLNDAVQRLKETLESEVKTLTTK
ncbi:MAG: hypothetical protein WC342_01515 [Methanoregula sp.]|jgi:hypothetical protein